MSELEKRARIIFEYVKPRTDIPKAITTGLLRISEELDYLKKRHNIVLASGEELFKTLEKGTASYAEVFERMMGVASDIEEQYKTLAKEKKILASKRWGSSILQEILLTDQLAESTKNLIGYKERRIDAKQEMLKILGEVGQKLADYLKLLGLEPKLAEQAVKRYDAYLDINANLIRQIALWRLEYNKIINLEKARYRGLGRWISRLSEAQRAEKAQRIEALREQIAFETEIQLAEAYSKALVRSLDAVKRIADQYKLTNRQRALSEQWVSRCIDAENRLTERRKFYYQTVNNLLYGYNALRKALMKYHSGLSRTDSLVREADETFTANKKAVDAVTKTVWNAAVQCFGLEGALERLGNKALFASEVSSLLARGLKVDSAVVRYTLPLLEEFSARIDDLRKELEKSTDVKLEAPMKSTAEWLAKVAGKTVDLTRKDRQRLAALQRLLGAQRKTLKDLGDYREALERQVNAQAASEKIILSTSRVVDAAGRIFEQTSERWKSGARTASERLDAVSASLEDNLETIIHTLSPTGREAADVLNAIFEYSEKSGDSIEGVAAALADMCNKGIYKNLIPAGTAASEAIKLLIGHLETGASPPLRGVLERIGSWLKRVAKDAWVTRVSWYRYGGAVDKAIYENVKFIASTEQLEREIDQIIRDSRDLIECLLINEFAERGLTLTSDQLAFAFARVAVRLREQLKATALAKQQTDRFSAALKPWQTRLARTGYRLGWFGYRTTIVGRILMRWWLAPIQDAIQAFVNWQKAVGLMTLAIGMLGATAHLTGRRYGFLLEGAERIMEIGPKFTAAWMYMSAVMLRLSLEVAEPLIPLFYEIGDMLMEIAPIVRDTLGNALRTLVGLVINNMDVIKEFIIAILPPLASGFIWGAKTLIGLVNAFVNASTVLGPFLNLGVKLLGFFMSLSPLLVPVGLGLYLVSSALTGFGNVLLPVMGYVAKFIIMLVNWRATLIGVAFKISGFITTLMSLNPWILAIVAAVTAAVIIFIKWKDIVKWITNLLEKLKKVLGGVAKWFSNIFGGVKKATDSMEGAVNATAELGESFDEIQEDLQGFCFRHIAPDIRRFAEQMSYATIQSRRLHEELTGLQGNLGGMRGGMPGSFGGPLSQTVYVTVEIGTVTSEVDLDQIVDAVSRGIAESRRRLG